MAKKLTTRISDKIQISSNTQIVFTLKSFITTIGTILGIFYGFYQLVVVPKINSTEEHYKTMFDDQKKQNQIFYDKLGNINSSIGSLNATIESMDRDKPNQQQPSTGGSLSNKITTNIK